jgi:hypothetical protein
MGIAIKLSNDIVKDVRTYAAMCHRSVPKQIEFWIKVGKAAEENPDLPYNFIKGTLMAMEEDKHEEYIFGS